MSDLITIIDYGSGNLKSAEKAFERAAREGEFDAQILVTDDAEIVRKATRIVLPGVGAFADCRAGLFGVPGMAETLKDKVENQAVPFFGICVGMQLMANRGMEKGTHKGFGWIEGDVIKIAPTDADLKVPHMGWNTIDVEHPHVLLEGIDTGPTGLHAYFVHSFHLQTTQAEQRIAVADYGGETTAMVGRDNMVGTQFHPEKSQRLGLQMISNFLRWKP